LTRVNFDAGNLVNVVRRFAARLHKASPAVW